MPLLDIVEYTISKPQWGNTLVIACQHLLESNFLYFKRFIQNGLPAKQIYLLGKSYSTNQSVMKDFVNMGVNVHFSSNQFDSWLSFNEQFGLAIKDFFLEINAQITSENFERIVLIDDGAELLLYANQYLNNSIPIYGVEQTSSGFHKLSNQALKFPVINVARSQAKLELESPFIAEAILDVLQERLCQHKLKPIYALIIGSGAIGECIFHQLKQKHFVVSKFDIDKHKSDFDHIKLQEILPDFDMVISCVGKTVLDVEEYAYLKNNVVLVSASSSDTEFSAVKLRKKAPVNNNVHQDVKVIGPNGNIILLNGGFPLNFDGTRQRIPLDKIQLTEALLYSAACMAATRCDSVGLHDFDHDLQNALIDNFKRLINNIYDREPEYAE
jgi:S-adenosylhomocysteine hydrolase